MIYTVTFNPSIDYVVVLNEFQLKATNRSVKEQVMPGGKGINVSIVLNNLGIKNTALGFIAGFTGDEIERAVKAHGCITDFIKLDSGISRINLKLKVDEETEINATGPVIEPQYIELLLQRLDTLKEGDILVLAGSIPASMPDTIYQVIMDRIAHKKVLVVVDATKDLLLNVLDKHPFLIKPNKHELEEIFGVSLNSADEIMEYAKRLQGMGARNVIISMAGDGGILISEEGEVYVSPAPKGKVINSVGAGDSMVAGFIAGFLEKKEYEYAFKMGISAGSASAFSKELATKLQIVEILKTLIPF